MHSAAPVVTTKGMTLDLFPMIEVTRLTLTRFLNRKEKIVSSDFFEILHKIVEKSDSEREIQCALNTVSALMDQHYPDEPITFDIANKLCSLYLNLILLQKNRLSLSQKNVFTLHEMIMGDFIESPRLNKISMEKSVNLERVVRFSSLLLEHVKNKRVYATKITPFSKKMFSHQLKITKKNIIKLQHFLTISHSLVWIEGEKTDPVLENKLFDEKYKIYLNALKALINHRRELLLFNKRKKTLKTLNPLTIKILNKKMKLFNKKLPVYIGIASLAFILYEDLQKKITEEKEVKTPHVSLPEIKPPMLFFSKENHKFFKFLSISEAINNIKNYLFHVVNTFPFEAKQTERGPCELFQLLKSQIYSIFNAQDIETVERSQREIASGSKDYSKESIVEMGIGNYTDVDAFSYGISALIHLKKLSILSLLHQDAPQFLPYQDPLQSYAEKFQFIAAWAEKENAILLTKPPLLLEEYKANVSRGVQADYKGEEEYLPRQLPSFYQQHKRKIAAVMGFVVGIGVSVAACFLPVIGPILGSYIICVALGLGIMGGWVGNKISSSSFPFLKKMTSCCVRNAVSAERGLSSASKGGMSSTGHMMIHPVLPIRSTGFASSVSPVIRSEVREMEHKDSVPFEQEYKRGPTF